jgi:dolichol-phosphate mannosyltransferase
MTRNGSSAKPAVDLSIVIPCHNEEAGLADLEQHLGPVLQALCATTRLELVLVDDGSSDATWERMQALAAGPLMRSGRVLLERHECNRGLGAALRTGFGVASGQIIVTTDSDATYRFSEIPALLERLSPGIDVVTASPYHPDGGVDGVPAYRLVLSRGSSLIYRLLVGGHLRTYTALFRAYRQEVIRSVSFKADGFLAVAEVLVNAMLSGYRVAEYPTVLHSRVAGVSKAKLARTIAAHVRFQFAVLLQRMSFGSQKVYRTPA